MVRLASIRSVVVVTYGECNNTYVFGIRGQGKSATHRAAALMAQKRFDAKLIHTHTFPLAQVPTAIRYARERVEDAIKVVVQIRDP
jgi:L-iditol 2-dehydrogenase